jgi:putative transposase
VGALVPLRELNSRAGTRPAPTDTVDSRAGTRPAPTSLGDVVGVFKSLTTHAYIVSVAEFGWAPFCLRLWQRNYFERIIRDNNELAKFRSYIMRNPERWEEDEENPTRECRSRKNSAPF